MSSNKSSSSWGSTDGARYYPEPCCCSAGDSADPRSYSVPSLGSIRTSVVPFPYGGRPGRISSEKSARPDAQRQSEIVRLKRRTWLSRRGLSRAVDRALLSGRPESILWEVWQWQLRREAYMRVLTVILLTVSAVVTMAVTAYVVAREPEVSRTEIVQLERVCW